MNNIKNLAKGPLKDKIIRIIKYNGPLTVANYMRIVLTNPESGFYMDNDVFGVKGHFTTNPEISQIFGEILGAWIIQEWRRFNQPKPLRLIEFGPGRGTLMADIIRTMSHFRDVSDLQIRFIEVSPHLRKVQEHTIDSLRYKPKTRWFNHLEELNNEDEAFSAFIAHEYLDALPIHKFVVDPRSKQWREVLIDFNDKDELIYSMARAQTPSTKLLIPSDFIGDHFEVCPEAAIQLQKIASIINRTGKGCMIMCDYGFEQEPENRDTFRAFKNHEPWPALKDPGEADITADVDFGYLKRHLQDGVTLFGSVTQAEFLSRCGLQARLSNLLKSSQDRAQQDDLISGAKMMVEGMGQRYRFLSLFPKESKPLFENDPPAGFTTSVN